jgi:hypothetical protein
MEKAREFLLERSCFATRFSWRSSVLNLYSCSLGLTFDMRGAQKAQPFGYPLDGRVRRRCSWEAFGAHTS